MKVDLAASEMKCQSTTVSVDMGRSHSRTHRKGPRQYLHPTRGEEMLASEMALASLGPIFPTTALKDPRVRSGTKACGALVLA